MMQKIRNAYTLGSILVRRMIRKAQQKPIIHVVGDSHTLLFQHPLFYIHYLGPVTAYNIGHINSSTQGHAKVKNILSKYPAAEPLHMLFVLGEIDARIHIYNQHKKTGRELNAIVRDTANKYIEHIVRLKEEHPNLNAFIFNILPPGEQGNFYNYPHYADRSTRLEITRVLNQAIINAAKPYNIPVIEVFDKLLIEDERKREYIYDEIHFNNRILPLVISKFQEQGFNI